MKRSLAYAVAPTLAFALFAGVTSISLAEQSWEERVELRLSTEGNGHVLVLDDFDALPVGATETVWTEGGTEALVTRLEDGLLVEIAGEQFEIGMPEPGRMTLDALQIDFRGHGLHEDGKKIVIVTSDEVHEFSDHEHVSGHGSGGERRIVIRTADGEDASDVEVEVDHRVIVIDRRSGDSED